MKKEINGSEIVYLISLFCMPVITFIGIALLLNNIIKTADALIVTKYDISNVFFREIALFISCWMLLYATYIFHKIGFKTGHIFVLTVSIGLLLYAIYNSVNNLTSIANLVDPIIVGYATIYGLLKPLSKITVKRRKERVKNTLEKYTKVEPKKRNNRKSNKR